MRRVPPLMMQAPQVSQVITPRSGSSLKDALRQWQTPDAESSEGSGMKQCASSSVWLRPLEVSAEGVTLPELSPQSTTTEMPPVQKPLAWVPPPVSVATCADTTATAESQQVPPQVSVAAVWDVSTVATVATVMAVEGDAGTAVDAGDADGVVDTGEPPNFCADEPPSFAAGSVDNFEDLAQGQTTPVDNALGTEAELPADLAPLIPPEAAPAPKPSAADALAQLLDFGPGKAKASPKVGAKAKAKPKAAKPAPPPVVSADSCEIKDKESLSRMAEAVQKTLKELKHMKTQPPCLKTVLQATAVLLDLPDKKPDDLKKVLAGPDRAVVERLQAADLDAMTAVRYRKLQRLLAVPEFGEDVIRTSCASLPPLANWCRSAGLWLQKVKFPEQPAEPDDMSVDWCASEPMLAEAPPPAQEKATAARTSAMSPRSKTPPARSKAPPETSPTRSKAPPETSPPRAKTPPARGTPRTQSPRQVAKSLAEAGFVITPDITKLKAKALQRVEELTVDKPGVGGITFHGVVDCTGLDFCRLVKLDIGSVIVYPEPGSKPAKGEGLNRRATVRMEGCWIQSGNGKQDPEKIRRRIKKMTEEKKAEFVGYDLSTGVWTFRVEEF